MIEQATVSFDVGYSTGLYDSSLNNERLFAVDDASSNTIILSCHSVTELASCALHRQFSQIFYPDPIFRRHCNSYGTIESLAKAAPFLVRDEEL